MITLTITAASAPELAGLLATFTGSALTAVPAGRDTMAVIGETLAKKDAKPTVDDMVKTTNAKADAQVKAAAEKRAKDEADAAAKAEQAAAAGQPGDDAKPVELADLQLKVMDVVQKKGPEVVRAVCTGFGVAKLTELDQSRWGEALAELDKALAA